MYRVLRFAAFAVLVCAGAWGAFAQVHPVIPGSGSPTGPPPAIGMSDPMSAAPFDTSGMGLLELNSRGLARDATFDSSPLQNPALTVSQLDLRAPKSARREFEKGFQLFSAKQYQPAVDHFLRALAVYPKFVAAHNALGSAYMALNRDDDARNEFATAAVLDPHLPAPFLNLAYVEFATRHYPSALVAAQKAAGMAPLDLSALSALAYAQLMNKDYDATIDTTNKIHRRDEGGHSIVHLYAAAASENEGNLPQARSELQTLIHEDPKSKAAAAAHDLLNQLNSGPASGPAKETASPHPSESAPPAHSEFQQEIDSQKLQDAKEQAQVTEAEAMCEGCETEAPGTSTKVSSASSPEKGWVLRSNVDEVAVWFVATDHGKPVRDLTQSEVTVRDAGKPPAAMVAFRSENQLPLRLGLVIDTSESVAGRFKFEQTAASDFLQKVLTNEQDLAFAVGVSNSVRLVQDFTSDKSKLAEGIQSLAPAGGTALWDGVSFAAEKLSSQVETQPVARVLVVISDGQDNSSLATLKQAIEIAEHKDITVYTVSTSDVRYMSTAFIDSVLLGDRALKTLADRTGGMALSPGSIGSLNHSLDDLQELIRSRYALAYKPALLKHDDPYRTINITAEISGHKLRVYARKGYYARASFSDTSTP